MGLLDHYKQYEGMPDEEVSAKLKAVADERRRKALARIEVLDLSSTAWYQFPHPDVVAAITYAARRGINRPGDSRATDLRRELGEHLGLAPERVVVGNGAAELLALAVRTLVGPGDELVTPWPSYPLYPLAARRAGGRAVPVNAGPDPELLLAAVTDRTRVLALCNPNDPTGERLETAGLRALLEHLPRHVTVLLDEALAEFADAEPAQKTLELLDDFDRLLIFRTFSKAYGLAGIRCGYALGGPGAAELLESLAPPLGISAMAEAGATEALRKTAGQIAHRRETVAAERRHLRDAFLELGVQARESQANFLWLRVEGLDAGELSLRLKRAGVEVFSGTAVGDDDHVRAAVQSRPASDRLLDALRKAV
jgi:histidinol-phosphate aminotransferase